MNNIGCNTLLNILRINRMLIDTRRSYHITTKSHHRLRKHLYKMLALEINKPDQGWGLLYNIHWAKRKSILLKYCY